MTKLRVSANVGHHQDFHPKDLYAVRVFIESVQPRIDVEISSSRSLN